MAKKMFFMLSLLLIFSACTGTMDIADVKSDDMLGNNVTVKGIVSDLVVIGSFTGYKIIDSNGDEIIVLGGNTPEKGKNAKIKGMVKKAPILGYYIEKE